jgi:hypothetical protein
VSEDTCLLILNPRRIPECLISLERLPAPKVWLENYSELELESVIPDVIRATDFDYYSVVSDDCVVSQDAYEAVLSLRSPEYVATGYCNLDTLSDHASLITKPLPETGENFQVEDYAWMTLDEVRNFDSEIVPSFFAGMAFTTMHRDMWTRFPWTVYGRFARGWAADSHLAQRLYASHVRIFAHKWGMIYHTKPNWQLADNSGRRELTVGAIPGRIRYDIG